MMKKIKRSIASNSHRLNAFIKLIGKTKSFIDIGTDHGFVPIYLAKNKLAKKVYATDISEKCLNKAIENAKKNGVYSQINFFVSNGFEKVESGKYSKALIAGMGGAEIVNILQNKPKNVKVTKLYLQANTNVLYLKQWINNNNFKIITDEIIKEKNKFYNILEIKQGRQNLTELELNFGKNNLKKMPEVFTDYLKYYKNKYEEILNRHKSKKIEESLKVIKEVLRSK